MQSMARRGPSHSGPHGLACANCFKSKSKCIARPGAHGGAPKTCQRCHRRNEQCRPSDLIRRRADNEDLDSRTRIGELVREIDGVISHFRARHPVRTVIDDERDDGHRRHSQRRPDWEPFAGPFAGSESATTATLADNNGRTKQAGAWKCSVATSDSSRLEADIDELLSSFRSRMLPNFAFMDLPAELAAQKLRKDRPFLFGAILHVAMPAMVTADRVMRDRELDRSICEATLELEEGAQSGLAKMDFLLALLTYLAWGRSLAFDGLRMPRLMMHAILLVRQMRLDQAVPERGHITEPVAALFAGDSGGGGDKFGYAGQLTPAQFLERQRAVLGCFVLSSAVSAYCGHVDALRWTTHMEQGLAAISANKACPTDEAFALQVRLQLLAYQSNQLLRQHDLNPGSSVSEASTSPALMSLETHLEQLHKLQPGVSSGLLYGKLAMAHAHSVELCLNLSLYSLASTVPVMLRQFGRMTRSGPTSGLSEGTTDSRTARHEQTQRLWQCTRSGKACVSAMLGLSPSELANVSFIQWEQLTRSVAVLHHLATELEDPIWDRQAMRADADVPGLLDGVVNKLRLVAEWRGEKDPGDAFTSLACKLCKWCSDGYGV